MILGLGNTIPSDSVRQGLGGGGGDGLLTTLAFDGVNDYLEAIPQLQITTDLSISFWFKGSSTADQAIVAKDSMLGYLEQCFWSW